LKILVSFFCIIFGILRKRIYLVFPDGSIERTYLKYIPDIVHNRKENKDYSVITVVGETINKTMIYYYLKLDNLSESKNKK
jgi:hypothetical protein